MSRPLEVGLRGLSHLVVVAADPNEEADLTEEVAAAVRHADKVVWGGIPGGGELITKASWAGVLTCLGRVVQTGYASGLIEFAGDGDTAMLIGSPTQPDWSRLIQEVVLRTESVVVHALTWDVLAGVGRHATSRPVLPGAGVHVGGELSAWSWELGS